MKASVLLLGIALIPELFAQVSDVTPPALVSLDFNPKTINASTGPATVTVTATITDDLSGYSRFHVGGFQSPTAGQIAHCSFTLQSGTPQDGVYQCTVTFPQYSEAGLWSLGFPLMDVVGNLRRITPASLEANGLPSRLNVISISDLTPPQVISLTYSPPLINVGASPQTIAIDVGLTDDLSGTHFDLSSSLSQFVLLSPSGSQRRYVVYSQFSLLSGTPQNGVWRANLTMSQYAEPGVWTLESAQFVDRVGNRRSVTGAQLQASGISPTFTVVSSPSDEAPPTLVNLILSPTFINTSAGTQNISATLTIQDNLSGVSFERTTPGASRIYGVFLSSPSGNQGRVQSLTSLLSGSNLSGTWQGAIPFPQFSEAGTWSISGVALHDNAWNEVILDTSQLQALNLPTTVEVIRPSGGIDGSASSGGGTVQDEVFGARAQLTFPPNVLSGPTNVAIDVLSSPLSVPIPQGYSSAGTAFVNIDLTPHPTGLLPAPGLTLTIPLRTSMTPGVLLTLFRINPATAALVPAVSVAGTDVVGPVTPDGLNVTFTGIASLSTVAGLVSGPIQPGDLNSDGRVDCADLAIVRASFGSRDGQPGFDGRADVNRDKIVNINDLAYVSKRLPPGTRCQ